MGHAVVSLKSFDLLEIDIFVWDKYRKQNEG